MTQSQSIDYDRVADLYDDYVRVGFDVPFFLNAARQAAGGVLELMSGTGRVSRPPHRSQPSTAIVDGCEFFEEYDADGMLRSKRLMEIHYALISREKFEAMIESIGFKVVALHGDYAGSDFSETSPFMIWALQE